MSPGLAPWPVLLDPFRVGAWVVPQVRRCVLFPRACALGYPARPFQGHLRPVPGSPAGMSAKLVTIGTDRGWLLTAVPLRLIRVSQGTDRRCTPTVSRVVGNSQRNTGQIRASSASESVSGSQSLSGSKSMLCRSRHQRSGLQFCTVFDTDCDSDCDPAADTERCCAVWSASCRFHWKMGFGAKEK